MTIKKTNKSEIDLHDEGRTYQCKYGTHSKADGDASLLKPQSIKPAMKDDVRDRFTKMRKIDQSFRFGQDYFELNHRIVNINTIIFYHQGRFMENFADDYTKDIPLTKYYPNYQVMGYEQLRCYFSWRTKVRNGNITNTSLSYAYVYMYELLNNIGVSNPQDGQDKLLFFWKTFRVYNRAVDHLALKWLKEYHIYYDLLQPFHEFVKKNHLNEYYPKLVDYEGFTLYSSVSHYNIRKSAFVKENTKLVSDCFSFVLSRLQYVFNQAGISFEEAVIQPSTHTIKWTPFWDAIFYPKEKGKEIRVLISANEIYLCKEEQWLVCKAMITESGSRLMGYIFRLLESTLRRLTSYPYKYKLSANIEDVKHEAVEKLAHAGYSLEQIVSKAVMNFYRETNKTIVMVDHESLSMIRKQALVTQEKLIIQEQENVMISTSKQTVPLDKNIVSNIKPSSNSTIWVSLKNMLSETEIQALSVMRYKQRNIKEFADECGIMLEVLIDGINEKAIDTIGDNLIDEGYVLYEDYQKQIQELVG